MASAQYRQYMEERLRAAAKAKSAEERTSLLQLAQTRHRAANSLEERDKLPGETPQALERVSHPEGQGP
jgi:hypothetical protein